MRKNRIDSYKKKYAMCFVKYFNGDDFGLFACGS